MNNIRSTLSSWREYLTPVTHTSTFKTTGEITPEEFVAAGDYLVYKFPTWQWSPAPKESLEKNFLPPDKQFLVTRKVPSYQRALTYLAGTDEGNLEEEQVDENGWTTTHVKKNETSNSTGLPESHNSVDEAPIANTASQEIDDLVNGQEIQDIDEDEFDIEPAEPQESGNKDKFGSLAGKHKKEDKRNYDLFITYSTSYRVPKMYLVGFDSNGIPLTPNQMFEDIAADYRDKTATIEKAPFLVNTTSVSIHPCRHAAVMKVLMNRAQIAAQNKKSQEDSELVSKGISKLGLKDSDENGPEADDVDWENVNSDEANQDIIRVDQYLVIFLKFIASVTPGIYHDYTMDAF